MKRELDQMPHGVLKLDVGCDCQLVAHRYRSNLIFQAIDLESEFTVLYQISCQFTINFLHISSYEFLLLPVYNLLLECPNWL